MKEITIKYKPEFGKEIKFAFDFIKAKKYGFEDLLLSLASLSEEYSIYINHAVKSEKAKIFGLTNENKVHLNEFKKQGIKTNETAKIVHKKFKGIMQDLENNSERLKMIEQEIKKNQNDKIEQLKQDLMDIDLSFEELTLIDGELKKNKEKYENEGLIGNIKYNIETLQVLQEALADPEKAMKRNSPILCATCLLILLIGCIIGIAGVSIYLAVTQ